MYTDLIKSDVKEILGGDCTGNWVQPHSVTWHSSPRLISLMAHTQEALFYQEGSLYPPPPKKYMNSVCFCAFLSLYSKCLQAEEIRGIVCLDI